MTSSKLSRQTPKPSILEFDALGTHWWVTFLDKNTRAVNQDEIINIVRKFEQDYSRFKPDSYVSRLNTDKLLENPPQEFVQILRASMDYFSQTDGIFNISVGSKLEQDGYGFVLDSTSAIALNLKSQISIDDSIISIGKSVRIDLGGIGKGWLIDKLADYLLAKGCESYIINGGGDIALSWPEPIEFALEHPLDESQYIGSIFLQAGGFAVSSVVKRTWQNNGTAKQHIIPTKGTLNYIASFVTAKNAVEADVMATVLLLSDNQSIQHYESHTSIEFMLIRPDLSFLLTPNFKATLH